MGVLWLRGICRLVMLLFISVVCVIICCSLLIFFSWMMLFVDRFFCLFWLYMFLVIFIVWGRFILYIILWMVYVFKDYVVLFFVFIFIYGLWLIVEFGYLINFRKKGKMVWFLEIYIICDVVYKMGFFWIVRVIEGVYS